MRKTNKSLVMPSTVSLQLMVTAHRLLASMVEHAQSKEASSSAPVPLASREIRVNWVNQFLSRQINKRLFAILLVIDITVINVLFLKYFSILYSHFPHCFTT